MEEMPEIELLIDATEQERRRPKEGRKKRHVIKSQVVVEKREGLILDVSNWMEGESDFRWEVSWEWEEI